MMRSVFLLSLHLPPCTIRHFYGGKTVDVPVLWSIVQADLKDLAVN